jgi:hypothetical protein
MIDEAELLRSRDERAGVLLEILNAGYRKGQTIRRCDSGTYELREFSVYCPKVVVLIGDPEDTLADRSIAIRMRRKIQGETIERFILAKAQRETAQLKKACEDWALANQNQVVADFETIDVPFLADRAAELWMPLFTVCMIAAPHRLADLEKAARLIAGHKGDDESGDLGIRLLSDIREIFAETWPEGMPSFELLNKLNSMEEAPWRECHKGKPLNARALAKLLQPFGVHSGDLRFGPSVLKGYLLEDLEKCSSVTSIESATALQPA